MKLDKDIIWGVITSVVLGMIVMIAIYMARTQKHEGGGESRRNSSAVMFVTRRTRERDLVVVPIHDDALLLAVATFQRDPSA